MNVYVCSCIPVVGNTRGTRDAASSNIADYNAFVQSQAELMGADMENCRANAGHQVAIRFRPLGSNWYIKTQDIHLAISPLDGPSGRIYRLYCMSVSAATKTKGVIHGTAGMRHIPVI